MKILFLSHSFFPDIGGIEMHSEILAHSFANAGHEVHLVTWSCGGTEKDFPFAVIRNPGKYRLIQEHKWADVVFENNPCVRLAWPSFFLRRPLVIALHTWISRINGTISWIDKLKIKRLILAKRVIACSHALRLRCWPDSTVIANPYQDNLFKVLPDVNRSKDFVFLGRLVSDKGVDLALRAIHKLIQLKKRDQNSSNDISFTIIGNGPERETLEKLVHELGLEKNITFKGALKGGQLVECLNEHRFLLVPSVWEEPFGMVALEGMACGCLPIVSDGGGLPDAIGKAGLTFERGNVDSLVSTIQQVWNDQELEKKLRTAIPEHLSLHQQELITKRYLTVIEEVM